MSRLGTYWVDQAKWWRSRSLEWWAAHLTALYVGGAITIMGAKFDELIALKLNEMGDLAAGTFGPVAFLWLVLGYMQQGRELKLSSDALRLQADELKNSVEQQSIMASAALKQIESQSLAFDLQLQERERQISALFSFEFISDHGQDCPNMARLKLTNYGGWADHVVVIFEPPIGDTSKWYYPFLRPDQTRFIDIDFSGVDSGEKKGECRVQYVGLDKNKRSAVFSYVAIPEKFWAFVKTPNESGDIW